MNNWANPDDTEKFVATLKKHGQVDNMEVNVHLKNDRELPFLVSARSIRVGGEYCIISIARDITEWQAMAKKLKTSHEKLIIEQVKLRKKNTTVRKAEHELRTAHEKLVTEQVALRGKNFAMKEVMGQIESEKKRLQIQVRNNVERIIKPILRNLEPKIDTSHKQYVKLLENSLDDITESFTNRIEIDHSKLSPRELEVCNMIKNGMSSKDIAFALNISVYTVHNQRRNIRKKLEIKDNKSNLFTFLRSN